MIQKIIDQPWVFIAFIALIVVLWLGASMRTRRDRMLKHRARVNRRDKIRAERDRRWKARN